MPRYADDGWTVSALEIVTKRLRVGEVVNVDGLASDAHIGDSLAEQGSSTWSSSPQSGGGCAPGGGGDAYGFIVPSI